MIATILYFLAISLFRKASSVALSISPGCRVRTTSVIASLGVVVVVVGDGVVVVVGVVVVGVVSVGVVVGDVVAGVVVVDVGVVDVGVVVGVVSVGVGAGLVAR